MVVGNELNDGHLKEMLNGMRKSAHGHTIVVLRQGCESGASEARRDRSATSRWRLR
jgi:hypothetical protein